MEGECKLTEGSIQAFNTAESLRLYFVSTQTHTIQLSHLINCWKYFTNVDIVLDDKLYIKTVCVFYRLSNVRNRKYLQRKLVKVIYLIQVRDEIDSGPIYTYIVSCHGLGRCKALELDTLNYVFTLDYF